MFLRIGRVRSTEQSGIKWAKHFLPHHLQNSQGGFFMKGNYQHIFTPLTVKNMTIKNRITMMPMGTNYGEQNGEMSFLHINYYEQRAKGGTGLIIVENASVDSPQGSNGTTQLRIDHDNYLPRLFKFCENIHRYGTCIAIQINHAGASAVSSRINMQPVSASDVPTKDGGDIPRPLTKEEILDIVKKYGQAAKRAQIAGFDAVEIHAGHSYLISQFLSPTTNKRTDEFGGSVENRTRFCRMVIEEVRKQVGPFFPIMLRLSADEMVEGGNTLEDTLKYLEYVQEEVDIFDVSCGLNSSIQYQIDANYMKDGWRSYMPRAVKEKFGKPCISMGNIRDPEVAENVSPVTSAVPETVSASTARSVVPSTRPYWKAIFTRTRKLIKIATWLLSVAVPQVWKLPVQLLKWDVTPSCWKKKKHWVAWLLRFPRSRQKNVWLIFLTTWNIVPLLWIICISLPEHRQHRKISASSIRT